MTPGARVAAAIAVLDQIQGGAAAEHALTAWARGSRFAGSKDRAAVRDHVFDVLRAKRSLGDGTGRALMQRLAQREGWRIGDLFSGDGHAPDPLTAQEQDTLAVPLALCDAARCDLPDWLWPLWQTSLGDDAAAIAQVQQGRADVFLRVNSRKGSATKAIAALAKDDVTAAPHPTVAGCLRVTGNARRVKISDAYMSGLVELQDAASQAAIRRVSVADGARVLDFCAGGGGKALGFADLNDATVFAHDIAPQRMRDLPARAARAGVTIAMLTTDALAALPKFDVVFCDAPCSGSGTWRRAPDAKWRFGVDDLTAVMQSQDAVLAQAAPLVAAGGQLVYATCSILAEENTDRVKSFCNANPDWYIVDAHQRVPDADGDGFYTCVLHRR